MTFVGVLCYIFAGVCFLIALHKAVFDPARVSRGIDQLRKDKKKYEEKIADYTEIVRFIETALREGKAGTMEVVRGYVVIIDARTFERYHRYLHVSTTALEKTIDSLAIGEELLEKLRKKV